MLSNRQILQQELQSSHRALRSDAATSHRRRPLHVLFVHRDAQVIDLCLQALEREKFTVSSDFVLNPTQCAEQLRRQTYDVIIIECPNLIETELQALELLHQSEHQIPLIFLTTGSGNERFAELTGDGNFEDAEQEHVAQLPMAIRRVLKEKKLRRALAEAQRALRHSQSLYRALSDNPAYGIYRCDANGDLLDVNQALVTMLGYPSKSELLAANQHSEVIPSLHHNSALAGIIPDTQRIDPVELEWKRSDGTVLRVRISGRGFFEEHGNLAGHEMIVVDVTEQRTLEGQLRHQASCDSLTGLANHGRLFEVLQSEICRSQRTGREFSLLLLDLDGLKRINDQFGHLVGSRALCRLAQVVKDCSRSIDTAARHGGDEFALVLPETGLAAATMIGHRICDLLAKDSEEPTLSVSLGAACFPRDADTIGTLLYVADRALYEMKARHPGHAGAPPRQLPTAAG
jgi:diguanylate cyclase (GGDEF)-like protein/PAS domain S-box-containing protein